MRLPFVLAAATISSQPGRTSGKTDLSAGDTQEQEAGDGLAKQGTAMCRHACRLLRTGLACGALLLTEIAAGNAQDFPPNPLRFGIRAELGGTWPGSSPELEGFFQNLDLGAGYQVAVGPYGSVPIGGGAGATPFALRFGAEAFFARLQAERVTNQLVPGVLPVSGHWRQNGVIPYGGLAWTGIIGGWQTSLFADVGYGFARHDVELRRTIPILEGDDTTGIFLARVGFETPITGNVRIGASASYLRSGGNDFRVLPGGPFSSFGDSDRLAVAAHVSADLVWRNTSGEFVVWHMDTPGFRGVREPSRQ
jgi:hypothetical protein